MKRFFVYLFFLCFLSNCWAGLELSIGGTFPRDVEIRGVGIVRQINDDIFPNDYFFTTQYGEKYRFSLPSKWDPNEPKKHDMDNTYIRGELRKDSPADAWLSVKELRTASEEERAPLVCLPSQRPARLVRMEGGKWIIDGVRTGPKGRAGKDPALDSYSFEEVTVSPDQVQEVYIGVQSIPPFFRHAFLLFTFKSSEDEEPYGLVISIEPLKRPNETKPLKEMLRGELPIVYQLSTWEDYTAYNCLRWQQKLNIWKMKMPQGSLSVKKWLKVVLAASVKTRLSERYDMNTNNCSSSILTMLVDEMDSEHSERLRKYFKGLLIITNPRRLPGVLHKCDIIDEEKRLVVKEENCSIPMGQLFSGLCSDK